MKGKSMNPFHLRWLEGWTFQFVLIDGKINIEANGYGHDLATEVLEGESPYSAADRLINSYNLLTRKNKSPIKY